MFKKIITWTGLFLMLGLVAAQAQDEVPPEGWQTSANLGLNLTQSGYSNSWEGNESGSITWTFTGDYSANRQIHPKAKWINTLKLLYGETHRQVVDEKSGDRNWHKPETSSDRIFLESLMNFTLGAYVDPYAALTAETQFYSEFRAPTDSLEGGGSYPELQRGSYLRPLLLTESAGIGKHFIEEEKAKLFSRLGFALRQNWREFVAFEGDAAPYTNWDIDGDMESDGGVEWVSDYERVFAEDRMKYTGKLRVFQALFNSNSDEYDAVGNDDWKTADIQFENTFSASITEYVQMTFFVEWLYDKQIVDKGRFRETLGLGLTYKLF